MATRNWEISKINKYGWYGKKYDDNASFEVHNSDLGWTFQASWFPYKNKDFIRRRFKNKIQAINFAKKYIRTH